MNCIQIKYRKKPNVGTRVMILAVNLIISEFTLILKVTTHIIGPGKYKLGMIVWCLWARERKQMVH